MKYNCFRKNANVKEIYELDEVYKSRWPENWEESVVKTVSTTTRVLSIKNNKPPLIILHGTHMLSSMFFKEAKFFSKYFSIYIPDIPGETGLTTFNEIPDSFDFYNTWLNELMDKLKICRSYFLGISFGGYLTLNFSTLSDRVISAGYISTAGLGGVNPAFLIRGLASKIFPTTQKTRRVMKWLNGPNLKVDDDFFNSYIKLQKNMKPLCRVFPNKIPKEILKGHRVKGYFYFGKNEVINNLESIEETIYTSLSHCNITIVDKRRHILDLKDYMNLPEKLLNHK